MSYCEFCGKPIPPLGDCDCPEAKAHREYISKNVSLFQQYKIPAIITAVVFVVIFVLALIPTFLKADPFDYMDVTFSGLDGSGTADVTFNKSDLLANVINPEPSEDDFEAWLEWEMIYERYSQAVDYSVDKMDNLSNGEIVTVTVTVTGEAGSKIKSSSKKYTVEGLVETQTIDVFQDIELKYDDVSGEASLKIVNNSENDFVKTCIFTATPNSDLSNGDEVTIKVSYETENALEYGLVPQETERKYTVSDLPSYVEDASQIPEAVISSLAESFVQEKETDLNEDYDGLFTYGEVTCSNIFFLKPKDADDYWSDENQLVLCARYDEYLRGEFNETVYSLYIVRDVLADADGNVVIDYEDGSNSTFVTDLEWKISDWEEDYIVTALK